MVFLNKVPDAQLYYVMVQEYVYDRNLWDDCVQEAAIHVWRMRQRHPDRTQAWYNKCARSKIQEVSTRQKFFGQPERRGVPADPLRQPHDSYEQLFTGWGNE